MSDEVPDEAPRGAPHDGPDDARVTVVIATRDRRAELTRTLRTLRENHPHQPVIVVDNASSDDTVAVVRRDFPMVVVITLPRNEGAAARNAGVARAGTPYVAFSDDDSCWAAGSLHRAAGEFDANPRLGLIAARTLVGPDERPDTVTDLLAGSPLTSETSAPGPRVLGFLACSAIVRREAFLAVGGFSPVLFFVGEEKLLAYDLAAHGWALTYMSDIVAHHYPSERRAGHAGREALERRNALLTAWMRRPVTTALRFTGAVIRDAGRESGARCALRGALASLPAALRDRRPLPESVERDVHVLEGGPVVTHSSGPVRPQAPADGDGRITVVVMTRNRREELLRTLKHMVALPEQVPLIVVDNGSEDGTAQAVAEALPEVTLLRSDRNMGAVARNVAVQRVRTPYVAFCDDDVIWEPGALPAAGDLLDAHPDLASVTGRILVPPDLTEDPITPELRHSPVPGPSWLPGPALLGIMAGASMLRTYAFRQVGGFSARLWVGGEEELLTLDLAARGWWACWAEEVTLQHAASTVREPRDRRRLGIRNTLWTTWLRRPVTSAVRRTVALLRAVPGDRASLSAVTEAVAGLPWVLRERHVVPAHVEEGLRLLEKPQRNSVARRYVDSATR